jgi:hypothetical protein
MAARTALNTILRDALASASAPQDDVCQILPDGQITFARRILSSPLCKNIPLLI